MRQSQSGRKLENKILFTIIIPAYNAEKYIPGCLNSLIDQDIENYEIIVVNDGSTDSTGKILDDYDKKHGFIKIIHKENSGVSDTRNAGLDQAQGEYVLFVDADDSINKVLKDLGDIIEKKESDIYVLKARMITRRKEVQLENYLDPNRYYNSKDLLIQFIKNKVVFDVVWLYCYRRSLLERHGFRFMSGRLHEDSEFIPKVLLAANKIYNTDILFYNYYIRTNSITQKKDQRKNAEDLIYISKSLKEEFAHVRDEALKYWLDDLIAYYYLTAVDRGKLSMLKDRDLLESVSIEDLSMRPSYKQRMTLLKKYPRLHEARRSIAEGADIGCQLLKRIITRR